MTVLLERARFLHVPKTGGTWVREALLAGCANAQPVDIDGSTPARWFETPGEDLFTFAFVRHPLAWWSSFWRFHKGPARRYVVSHAVCQRCWSEDFDKFIANVVREMPGHYGNLIETYVGPPGSTLDFAGRQEHLVDDLLFALEIAGEAHDPAKIRAVAAANVGDPSLSGDCSRAHRAALLASEAPMMKRFGYDADGEDPACVAHWRARLERA
jgi:hypothetical protein